MVQSVLTTSSHTVGERSMRPAPVAAHPSSRVVRGERVEGRQVLVEVQDAGDRGAIASRAAAAVGGPATSIFA